MFFSRETFVLCFIRLVLLEGCTQQKVIESDQWLAGYLGIRDTASPLNVPEIDDIRDHVRFQLHTRQTDVHGDNFYLNSMDLGKSSFRKKNPTKILIHGFLGRLRDGWMSTAKDALLRREEANVILVGWTNITQILLYPWVVEQSYGVAQYVADLIDFLVNNGVSLKGIHLIGHSIGAHIAGVASKDCSSGVVGRITGLDAAYPLYKGLRDYDKLDKSDAEFVDCIHTSSGLLGVSEPFCHADFYPNGGTLYQPGCDVLTLVICSHRRSHDYFVESINQNLLFKAYKCSNALLNLMDCSDDGAVMGYPCSEEHKGIFYVRTATQSPFSSVEADINRPTVLDMRKISRVQFWPTIKKCQNSNICV